MNDMKKPSSKKGSFFRRRSKKAGLPPGTIIPIEAGGPKNTTISFIDYDCDGCRERKVEGVEECLQLKENASVSWININGLGDIGTLERIGAHFKLHPLVVEDIATTGQRPKYEQFDDYIFLVLKMLSYDGEQDQVVIEQVSLILGNGFVLSFQEMEGDVFDVVRKRIRENKGRIRKQGADYLAYALCDAIVDNYFIVLEKLSDKLELLEDHVVSDPVPETLRTIHRLKQDAVLLRKSVWPLREVIRAFEGSDSPLLQAGTGQYLRDVYDHTIQVIDTIEAVRDLAAGMLDIYLSSVSNRMNEVMKVLTIIATIFIPLGFIAGLYGMNFKNMPELQLEWGYFGALGFMGAIVVGMLVYFRRKRWL